MSQDQPTDQSSSKDPSPPTKDEEEVISRLADDLLKKTGSYVRSELEVSLADYKLLEDMNGATAKKYSDLKLLSHRVSQSMEDLDSNFSRLSPYLEKIDGLEAKVARLEEVAYSLDAYSKRLETKFRTLENRN